MYVLATPDFRNSMSVTVAVWSGHIWGCPATLARLVGWRIAMGVEFRKKITPYYPKDRNR